jgi:hypothetical protein
MYGPASYDIVVDAYYSTALSYRYLQNPESVDMLALIYEGIRYEIGIMYSGNVLSTGFTTMLRNIATAPSKRYRVDVRLNQAAVG